VALKRAHTRANPKRPPATLVANLEKIIRRGRYLQRKTSREARTSRLGISRGINSLSIPRTPSIKSTFVEASYSQKIVSESENLKGDELSIDFVVIDLISEQISVHNLWKEVI